MKKFTLFLFAVIFSGCLYAQEYYALVRMGKDWGFIDKKGSYVINPQFDNAKSFSNGLARVFQFGSYRQP